MTTTDKQADHHHPNTNAVPVSLVTDERSGEEDGVDLESGTHSIHEDHVPLASAVLIDEGLHSDEFEDEPAASPASRSASFHSAASEPVITETLETLPIVEEDGSGGVYQHPQQRLLRHLGRTSQTIDCPHCCRECQTVTRTQVGGFAVFCSLFIVLVAWPLFFLPLVLPAAKKTSHHCNHCHELIGETEPCS